MCPGRNSACRGPAVAKSRECSGNTKMGSVFGVSKRSVVRRLLARGDGRQAEGSLCEAGSSGMRDLRLGWRQCY